MNESIDKAKSYIKERLPHLKINDKIIIHNIPTSELEIDEGGVVVGIAKDSNSYSIFHSLTNDFKMFDGFVAQCPDMFYPNTTIRVPIGFRIVFRYLGTSQEAS